MLAKSLMKVKQDFVKLRQDMYRIPSMIEEVEGEEDNFGSSVNNSKNNSVLEKIDSKESNDKNWVEEKDFEVPDKLKPTERDGTTIKKKKEEVVGVLAQINAATNLINQVVNKSPNKGVSLKAEPLEKEELKKKESVENPFNKDKKGISGLAESSLPSWAQNSESDASNSINKPESK